MNFTSLAVLVALASIVASSSANVIRADINGKAYTKGTPGFNYDCSGKIDGDYNHPTKCDHFVSCVGGTEAYEMPCALDHDDSLLHFVQNSGPNTNTSRCDYPENAGCAAPTAQPPQETTLQPAIPDTTAPPQLGDDCDPEKCINEGVCHDYETCDKDTKKWVHRTCDTDLYWNNRSSKTDPNPNGHIHGGNCDYFYNLHHDDQQFLETLPGCIEPCAWFQTDNCSPNYIYRIPFDGRTDQNRNKTLTCPSSDKGESLVWDQAFLTCRLPSQVVGCN